MISGCVILILALLLAQCGAADDGEPPSEAGSSLSRSTSPSSASFADDGIDDGGEGSIASALQEAGYNASDVRAVAQVGRETGYLWKSRPPTPEEEATFAYMVYLECVDVAAGDKTWEQSRDEAISTGATATDAATMTHYLEETFCPIGVDGDAIAELGPEGHAPSKSTETVDEESERDDADTLAEATGDLEDWAVDEPEESASAPAVLPGALHSAAFKAAIQACPEVDFEYLEADEGYPLVYDVLLLKNPRPQSDSGDLVYGAYVAQECFMTALGLPSSLRERISSEDEGDGTWTSANGAEWAITWIYDGTVIHVTYEAKERAYW